MAENIKPPSPGGGMSTDKCDLIERLKALEGIIATMNAEITFLKNENEKLKNMKAIADSNIKASTIQMY